MILQNYSLFSKNVMNHTKGETCIIAEAGINHDGDFEKARQLIDVAVKAKCTCVKFQTFNTDRHMSIHSASSSYIEKGSNKGESFFHLAKRLELSYDEQRELFNYAEKVGIHWISSHFDEESLEFLVDLGVPVLKVASGEITNFPLLKKAAKTKLPMIVSTGMASIEEIDEVVAFLKDLNVRQLILMHCVSWYPADVNDMNLKVIDTLLERYKIPIALSDHTLGISIPLAARAMGVKLFEKHFTVSKKDFGPDHGASLAPGELEQMVIGIEEVGRALGDGIKKVTSIEFEQRKVHRKSIVADKKIMAGDVLTEEMITIKRPGMGIQPKYYEEIIGYRAKQDIKQDDVLHWDMIQK